MADKRAFQRVVVAFIGLFGLVGLISLVTGVYLEERTIVFRLRAKTAAGTVSSKRTRSSYKGGSETQYYIGYRFTAPDGKRIQSESSTGYWQWVSAAPDTAITVYYMGDDPSRNNLSRPWIDFQSVVLLGVGCLFSFVGFVAGRAVVGDRTRRHSR